MISLIDQYHSMKYTLDTQLIQIAGVGPQISTALAKKNIQTVKDLLLLMPLRYEDRSRRATIDQLRLSDDRQQLVTLQVRVVSTNNYYKGRRSIQSATVQDETGRLKLMWFNNKFIIDRLKIGESYLISGKLNERGLMIQPVVENVKTDTIHTDRLVPIYSSMPGIKPGTLRRLLKTVCDNLADLADSLFDQRSITQIKTQLTEALKQSHFPDNQETIISSRERLALEELLALMKYSHEIKAKWQQNHNSYIVSRILPIIPPTLPFQLTQAQHRAVEEILTDLQASNPMNRLLIGDVGSGKTVVAAMAAQQLIKNQHSVCLIAPTQILAEQHLMTIQKLFPDLTIELVTAKTKKNTNYELRNTNTFFIGTHALINRLPIIKPALIIYDEQHRFGVGQRSAASSDQQQPHVLTMSATPIPRSLMLTIFSHLSVSVIDEMPLGRLETKTWLMPVAKKADSYAWMRQQPGLTIFVCPFIDPSNSEALENVAAVKDKFQEVKQLFPGLRVSLLHGRLTQAEKNTITQQLFSGQVDVLVTTPIIEVGMDLPEANIMVIEGAERFGLASLHQLRGRVGRAGQQGYCLLFTTSGRPDPRLNQFCQLHDGLKLAELDLKRRGGGNIFGVDQHGFDELKFGSWTDLNLITQARLIFDQIQQHQLNWQPFLEINIDEKTLPGAN